MKIKKKYEFKKFVKVKKKQLKEWGSNMIWKKKLKEDEMQMYKWKSMDFL
jgi:hypothetical protein